MGMEPDILIFSCFHCIPFILCGNHQVGKNKARPALSLVGYEDELRPAMEYVFGSTFVCDTLQSAKKVTHYTFIIGLGYPCMHVNFMSSDVGDFR